ncbi:MAG: oligosaccharide flippase family protein [Oleispira sp.]|nr:oligosaccharide flippase family protein [Oleispira sp.]
MKSKIDLVLSNDVARNSLFGMFFKLLGLGLGFVMSLLIANVMGVSVVGLIAFSTSIAMIIRLLIALGTDAYVVKLVAQFQANGKPADTNGLLRSLALYRAAVTAFVLLLFYILHSVPAFTVDRFDSEELRAFIIFIPAFVVGGLTDLWSGYLRGLKQSWRSFAIEQALVTTFTLTLVLLLYWGASLTLLTIAMSYLVSNILAVFIGFYVVVRSAPIGKPNRIALPPVLKSAFPFMITSSMYLVMSQTDTLMLGIMLSVEEVGVYSIALKLAMLTSVVLLVSNAIVAPKISELYTLNKMEDMILLARKVVTILCLIGGLVLLFFIFAGEQILSLWGVSEYSDLLLILAIGQFINLATGPVGNLLVMTKYAVLQSRIVMVMALINVVLNYWLITDYGIYGAAIATAIVVALTNIISWVMVWLKHGVAILPLLNIKGMAR